MNQEERLKSAVASSGGEEPDGRGGVGSDRRKAVEQGADQLEAQESDSEETEQQPGGGRWSESERPDSPDSRWGGGR
jgi:hypothetical protein